MILYYSGCGNSALIAREMAKLTHEKLAFIPSLANENRLPEIGESLGIICPIYAWDIPELVKSFLKRAVFTNKPSYIWLLCTCGDNTGLAHKRLDKILRSKGLRLDSAFSVIMPETYINLTGFTLDSPQVVQEKISRALAQLPTIAQAINGRANTIQMETGSSAWMKTYIINPLFYSTLVKDTFFNVNETCTGCGLCARECPLKNITIIDGKPSWGHNCTTCMSCYHRCPQNAINFGKETIGKGQYKCPISNNGI